jgi:acetolactate synthase-1/2/3 large subunit
LQEASQPAESLSEVEFEFDEKSHPMTDYRAADLVLKSLLAEGVEAIFSVSGDSILPIYDACRDMGLPIYHARSEASAVTMADGWARTTGRPGVCLVTFGAGAANCVGSMLNAYLDESPVVLISGRSATWRWGRGSFAEVDAVPLMRPVTKWAETVMQAERIPEHIHTAFHRARSGSPGPVFLQIPTDVLEREKVGVQSIEQPVSPHGKWMSQADPDCVAEAVEWIRAAKRPVIIAGSGVWWSGAGEALDELIRVALIPAFACYLGRGTLTHPSRFFFGLAAPLVNRVARDAAMRADLIILVGARFDFELEFGDAEVYNRDARVIQISGDPITIGRNRPTDLALIGDCKPVLGQLLELGVAPASSRDSWLQFLWETQSSSDCELRTLARSQEKPIHPAKLCYEIRDFLEPGAVVALGGGNIFSWGRTILEPRPPGRLLAPDHTWALGCAVSLGVGASVARPGTQTLILSGDGSLGYDLMEIDTAIRYKLPLVCVVANDASWSMISSAQEKVFGADRVYATALMPTPYHEIVGSMGGFGQLVVEPDQIRPALARAFASGVPACVNVHTSSADSPDLISWYG